MNGGSTRWVAGILIHNRGVGLAWATSENVCCGDILVAAGNLRRATPIPEGPGWTGAHALPVLPSPSDAVSDL